jgi:NitT/TauT family transport system substrate-binding protein
MNRNVSLCLLGFVVVLGCSTPVKAETSELRVAKQYGLGYLQMILMEEQGLVERHAKAAGLGDIKVSRSTFRPSDVMNDALLSGNIDFASVGAPGLAIIWSRTRGTPQEVKAAFGYNYFPTALNTRDPKIKTLADYTEKDKVAVPAVKVSNQEGSLGFGSGPKPWRPWRPEVASWRSIGFSDQG